MTFCPSLFWLAFESRILKLVPPAKTLSGIQLAATGTSIFAQYPKPRNRQIGRARVPGLSEKLRLENCVVSMSLFRVILVSKNQE